MQSLSLEEISFRNLVLFYEEQLREVYDGAMSTEVFTTRERLGLYKRGILIRSRAPNRRAMLSEKTKVVLRLE